MANTSDKLVKYMFVTGAVTAVVVAILEGKDWRDMGLHFLVFMFVFIVVAIALSGMSGKGDE